MLEIKWLGHDTFRIKGERVIYTDPFQIEGSDSADIILITHGHRDHCSPGDVKKVRGPETSIICTPDCSEKLNGRLNIMKPGDRMNLKGIEVEAVPAYNINKKFHPKESGFVGYIFTVSGKRIYVAGDTDRIPEMKGLIKCDIALLPVGGTYTMTAEEAVMAAIDINPSLAVPMHYGEVAGTEEDAKKFAASLEGMIKTIILKKGEAVSVK